MNTPNTAELLKLSHRILVIDDNPRIHEDIRKILCPPAAVADLDEDAATLFGDSKTPSQLSRFEIDSALQGQEGLALVQKALAEGRPYSMAFVDVRMPPGWDGIETIEHVWKTYPELQIVICTAYSDHSWDQIIEKLGKSDSLLILKKPFDNVEVLQLAHALTKKWVVTRQAKTRMDDLEAIVENRTAELVGANKNLLTEMTRRTKIEMALCASEDRFHKSFESALVSLAVINADTLEHTDVNASYLSLIGYSREQVMGKSLSNLNLTENPAGLDDAIKTLRTGERVHNLELNIRRADGDIRQTQISIVPMTLGDKTCFLAAVLDITDQRRLEAQLRQSQKMEAIGQLAAGIAHDFNNLLTIILGHTSMLIMKANADQDVAKSLNQVKLAGERAAGLTRQMLAFSRKQVLQRKPVNLTATISSMEKMVHRLVGETIAFNIQCAEKVPCILADESNIEQVLLNLIVNARDAMPQGGKITITASEMKLSGAETRRHEDAREGKFVVLTVSDNGSGMSAATQHRLFEPFFTTKPVGKGTGLGLSTVYGIVKQHEGWIELQSAEGAGTTFRIFFPATEVVAQLSDTPQPRNVTVDREECILVVDDEPQVRGYVCQALRKHGYKVLDADCGQAALEVWQKDGDKVDLLLTDMVMPNGITGSTLAKMLREKRQELKVIYMSGYSPELNGNGELLSEARNFLPKPFGQSKLFEIVDFAIDPTSGK